MTGVQARDSVASFAHDLTEARRGAGRSIRQVHRLTGIPTATLGGYFAGRHLPPANRPEVLREVLTACGVPGGEHEAWRQRLLDLYAQRRQVEVTRTPYPGLRPFEAADHDLFFGREELVARLLQMLEHVIDEQHPVLMVVGPSGSGKSSLLRAGLQATLADGRCTVGRPAEIEQLLRRTPEDAEPRGDRLRHVLVVDQLEELWTDPDLKDRSKVLLDLLREWAAGGPGRVLVLGLRADFYGEVMTRPGLAHALQEHQLLVEPMSPEALRAAIEGPARQVGLTLEPGLVEVILADAALDTAAVGSVLPHLAHVLDAMWSTSDRARLGVEDYRRTGGFAGAIRQSAEQALTVLPPESQALAMSLLLRLVTTAPAQGWTRRLAPLTELADLGEDAPEVLRHLVDHRLVTVRADDATLSHESLVGAWPRLREAVESRRGDLTRREALERAAADWDAHGRTDDHLLRGTRLQAVADWAASSDEPLTALQEDFLAASQRLSRYLAQERLTRARRRRAVIAVMAVLLLFTTGASLAAVSSFDQARTERNQAQSRQMATAAANLQDRNPGLSQQLAVAAHRTGQTREGRSAVLDATTRPVIPAWTQEGAVLERAAALPDGEHVLFAGPGGGVQVARALDTGRDPWRVVGTAPLDQLPGTPSITRLATHPGRLLAVAAGSSAPDDADAETDADAAASPEPAPEPVLALLDLDDPTTPASTLLEVPQLPTLRPVVDPSGTEDPALPTAVAFADDGRLLLAADSRGWLHRYAVAGTGTGTGAGTDPVEVGELVEDLAVSADGSLVAAALTPGTIRLWQVEEGRLRPLAEHDTGRGLFAVDVADDGSAVAAVGRSGLVHWLEVRPDGLEQTHGLFASDTNLFDVEVDSRAGLVAAAGWDGSVSMWRLGPEGPVSESPSLVLPVPRPVLTLEATPGRWIFATLGGTVYSWDVQGAVLPRMPGNVFLVDTSRAGERYMTATGPPDGAVTVWDASAPHAPVPLHTLRSEGEDVGTGAGAISPDGRLAALGTSAGRLLVWDVEGEDARQLLAAEVAPSALPLVMFTPDGDEVVAFARDGLVRAVDLDDVGPGRPRTMAVGEDELLGDRALGGEVLGAAVRDDGLMAVASSGDGVDLIDVADLDRTVGRVEPGADVYGVDFSPDGSTLALSLVDHTIRFYDVSDPASPTEVGERLTGPTSIPNSVKYAPDGDRLAVAAVGGQAWIYTRQGEEWIATEVLGAGLVNLQDVTWSPDGSVLLGGALSGRTRLWMTDPAAAADTICAGVAEPITREEWEGLLPGIDYAPPCTGVDAR